MMGVTPIYLDCLAAMNLLLKLQKPRLEACIGQDARPLGRHVLQGSFEGPPASLHQVSQRKRDAARFAFMAVHCTKDPLQQISLREMQDPAHWGHHPMEIDLESSTQLMSQHIEPLAEICSWTPLKLHQQGCKAGMMLHNVPSCWWTAHIQQVIVSRSWK